MLPEDAMFIKLEAEFFHRFGFLWERGYSAHFVDMKPAESEENYLSAQAATIIRYLYDHIKVYHYIRGFESYDEIKGADKYMNELGKELLESFKNLVSDDIWQNRETAAWLNHASHWREKKGTAETRETLLSFWGDSYGFTQDLINEISQNGYGEFFKIDV